MVLPTFGRTGTPATAPAQQPPAQQAAPQQQEEPVDWSRGWKMPENSGNRPGIQEFLGRFHNLQGIGKKSRTFERREGRNQGPQLREFLVLNFDWIAPMVTREGVTVDTEKPFSIEIPMSGSDQSGMGMFRASVAALSGIAANNEMLLNKLYEYQDQSLILHMVSVDDFQYGVNRLTGDRMQGMIWQVVDLYQEGDDGVLFSMVRKVKEPEPASMFEAVNEAAKSQMEESDGEGEEAPAPNPVQTPDLSQYDWSDEYALASQPNGCSWNVLRSAIREKYKADARMVNVLFTESNEFPSVLLEYFITKDIMRKVSEDGDPIQVVAVPGALG